MLNLAVQVSRFRGAEFKSFPTRAQAEEWLAVAAPKVPLLGVCFMWLRSFPLLTSDWAVESETFAPKRNVEVLRDTVGCPSIESFNGMRHTGEVLTSNNGPYAALPTQELSSLPPGGASGSVLDVPIAEGEGITLSQEQKEALNLVKAGKSVFFTGSAGTGKSVLLREIISWCRSSGRNYAVTASTGIAAINIGGCTLHSWAGIGLGKEPAERLAGKILGQEKRRQLKEKAEREARGLPALRGDSDSEQSNLNLSKRKSPAFKRWRRCQVLIIDESESSGASFAALQLTSTKYLCSMANCSINWYDVAVDGLCSH